MFAHVGCLRRHANVVTHAFCDFLITTGADVIFQRFVGLHSANLNVAIEAIPNRF